MEHQTLEDIERAAWYARLALGVYHEEAIALPVLPEKTTPTFHVLP